MTKQNLLTVISSRAAFTAASWRSKAFLAETDSTNSPSLSLFLHAVLCATSAAVCALQTLILANTTALLGPASLRTSVLAGAKL